MAKLNSDITKKVGKKSFFSDDYTLSSKLIYESGIDEFDTYLDGRTLKDIKGIIHLTKYPKGLVFKIVNTFSSLPFGLPNSEIKFVSLNEEKIKPTLVFETINDNHIVFSFNIDHTFEIKQFLDDINVKYHICTFNTNEVVKNIKPIDNTKHPIPTLISFFVPGLGQLIKKHFAKSVLLWTVGSIVILFFWWTLIIPLIIWIFNIYDAYNSNEDWDIY